jgi:hypothetical protein
MALARFWRRVRAAVALFRPQAAPLAESGNHGAEARARFWAELREGQREAEVQAAASPIRPGSREG